MKKTMKDFNPVWYNDKNDAFLPSSKSDILLMHPTAMESCDFKKGSPVLVSTSNGHLLLKCWPLDSLGQSDVTSPAFSIFESYFSSSVTLEHFSGSVLQSDRVVLSPIKYNSKLSHSTNSRRFEGFLKTKLDQLCIREGMMIKFEYLLCPCSFLVKRIVSYCKCENDEIIKEDEKLPDSCTDNSMDDSFVFEKSFEEKCNVSKSVSTDCKFQSSTPISSPNIPFHKKQNTLKLSKLCTNFEAFSPDSDCKHFYTVNSDTRFVIEHTNNLEDEKLLQTALESIGGLDVQLNQIMSFMKLLSSSDEKHTSRGILIIGPPGTGKSMVIRALQRNYKHSLSIHVVNKGTFTSDCFPTNKILHLRRIFKDAACYTPSVIFIEDIHNLCKSGEKDNVKEKGVRDELPLMIHSLLSSTPNVLVIATCPNESSVHDNLRKRGILDEEIRFPIPSPSDRKQILNKIAQRFKNDLTENQISDISSMTHGFVGGDLDQLFSKAILLSYNKTRACRISFHDLTESLKSVKPKSLKEFSFEVPKVKWDDIGGMDEIKNTLREMVEWPLKYPEKLKSFKINVPRGLLMYGPPGCCKTMIVKALAFESHLNFINIKSSQVFSKYVGDSEKSVSELFKKARSAAPCVLFLDEIDSLASKRGSSSGNSNVADRVLTQMLVEIDGIDVLNQGVYVIAATNRPDMIDPSLLRPGRFDRMIYVPLPDANTRRKIFEVILRRKPLSPEFNFKEDISYLTEKTENYTGAEISNICNEACLLAIYEDPTSCTSVLTMAHLLEALLIVQPRTTKDMIKSFENYHNQKISNSA